MHLIINLQLLFQNAPQPQLQHNQIEKEDAKNQVQTDHFYKSIAMKLKDQSYCNVILFIEAKLKDQSYQCQW